MEDHKKGRYPRAAHSGATIYHYGWIRAEDQMDLKNNSVHKFWGSDVKQPTDYREIDPLVLREFTGTHPQVVQRWLPPATGLFLANPEHQLTKREKKHRLMLKLESWLGVELSKKHYQLVR